MPKVKVSKARGSECVRQLARELPMTRVSASLAPVHWEQISSKPSSSSLFSLSRLLDSHAIVSCENEARSKKRKKKFADFVWVDLIVSSKKKKRFTEEKGISYSTTVKMEPVDKSLFYFPMDKSVQNSSSLKRILEARKKGAENGSYELFPLSQPPIIPSTLSQQLLKKTKPDKAEGSEAITEPASHQVDTCEGETEPDKAEGSEAITEPASHQVESCEGEAELASHRGVKKNEKKNKKKSEPQAIEPSVWYDNKRPEIYSSLKKGEKKMSNNKLKGKLKWNQVDWVEASTCTSSVEFFKQRGMKTTEVEGSEAITEPASHQFETCEGEEELDKAEGSESITEPEAEPASHQVDTCEGEEEPDKAEGSEAITEPASHQVESCEEPDRAEGSEATKEPEAEPADQKLLQNLLHTKTVAASTLKASGKTAVASTADVSTESAPTAGAPTASTESAPTAGASTASTTMDPEGLRLDGRRFNETEVGVVSKANIKRVDGVSDKSDNNKGMSESSVSLCKPEVGHVEASLEVAGAEVNMKLLILQELKSFEGEHEMYSDLCREFLNFPCSPAEKKLQMQSLEIQTSEAKAYVRKVVSGLSNKEHLVHLLEDVKNKKGRVQQDIINVKKDLKDEEKQQQKKQDKSKKKK